MGTYEKKVWTGLKSKVMRPGGVALSKKLIELAGLEKGMKILDIGCGMGTTSAYIEDRGFNTIGIDISEELIKLGLNENPGARLVRADAEKMPFEDQTIEAVLAECSLSVMEIVPVLQEVYRVLKPGGKVLMSDVYEKEKNKGEKLDAFDVKHLWIKEQWVECLEKTGFKCLLWEDHTAVWKEFAAQVIWQHGSLSVLFDTQQCGYKTAVRPGYFIAVACKK